MPEARNPKLITRDSVAAVIESRLHELARRGHGELKVKRQPAGIRLHFGAVAEGGSDYDTALLRLAKALLDDPSLKTVIAAALKGSDLFHQTAAREDDDLVHKSLRERKSDSGIRFSEQHRKPVSSVLSPSLAPHSLVPRRQS